MSLPFVVLTESYINPDGSLPTGRISFQLSNTLVAQGVTYGRKETVAPLVDGVIVQAVVVNNSDDAEPMTTLYQVTEDIDGTLACYWIAVPSAPPGSITNTDAVLTLGEDTITSATGGFEAFGPGAYLWSPGLPLYTQVVSVTSDTALVASQAALIGGTGQTLLVGASVNLGVLQTPPD